MTAAPALLFSGVVRYEGEVLLGPVEMTAEAGRWTCLLGPSGIGKSTMLRCFAGTADEVDFDGSAVAGDGAPLAGRVAMMAQSDMLLPWLTVRQNAALGSRLRHTRPDDARLDAILVRTGLTEHAGKKPGSLSGGQRQRAALARTLMEDRPVVLLDEPFSALDVATRARMQDLSHAAFAGLTVLHVTHDPAEAARLGDRIHVLAQGGLETVEPPVSPAPRAPDAPETLEAVGRLTRLLLGAVT